MDAPSSIASRVVVLGAAPNNLFGAAKVHRRYLMVLRELGAEAYQISADSDDLCDGCEDSVATLHSVTVRADARPGSDLISAYAVGEQMADAAASHARRGYRPLLIGSYLYPHCVAVLHAVSILRSMGQRAATIFVPAGSDVWQIGHGLPATTRQLLGHPDVSARVTYSKRFVEEIHRQVDGRLSFHVIPPPIDVRHFRPCSVNEKLTQRQALSLGKHDFVLVNCSNMRPVKELGLTLSVATAIADETTRPVSLLLVGPVTQHLAQRFGLPSNVSAISTPTEVQIGKVRVCLAGLQHDPRPYFWSADLAINTSVHDSFNVSLAESMACGVPILSTDVVGIAEVPGISDAGFFFPFEGDGIGPLRQDGQVPMGLSVRIDRSLPGITEWVKPLMVGGAAAAGRPAAARSVAERNFANEVVRRLWEQLLEMIF